MCLTIPTLLTSEENKNKTFPSSSLKSPSLDQVKFTGHVHRLCSVPYRDNLRDQSKNQQTKHLRSPMTSLLNKTVLVPTHSLPLTQLHSCKFQGWGGFDPLSNAFSAHQADRSWSQEISLKLAGICSVTLRAHGHPPWQGRTSNWSGLTCELSTGPLGQKGGCGAAHS